MNAQPQNNATLFIVATPIGNLADMSYRAISTLQSVSVIFAEDTRSFSRIRTQYEIKTQCESYHEHNENARTKRILSLLEEGKSIALISDAGTPLISDPGYRVVKAAKEAGYKVSPIPGPCAAIAALSASGLETDQFMFLGFLPNKEGKKRKLISDALLLNCTIICYESPHRILKTLGILEELTPENNICCAREISKLYEDIYTGTASAVIRHLEHETAVKGEFVLLIGKKPK
jgi:16S rRNA (cytidine1402-2'-O)-methyltransferase